MYIDLSKRDEEKLVMVVWHSRQQGFVGFPDAPVCIQRALQASIVSYVFS